MTDIEARAVLEKVLHNVTMARACIEDHPDRAEHYSRKMHDALEEGWAFIASTRTSGTPSRYTRPGTLCEAWNGVYRFVGPVCNQYVNDLGYFVSVDGGPRRTFRYEEMEIVEGETR